MVIPAKPGMVRELVWNAGEETVPEVSKINGHKLERYGSQKELRGETDTLLICKTNFSKSVVLQQAIL